MSLITREMQIETTTRWHLTRPSEWPSAIPRQTRAVEGEERREPSRTAGGAAGGAGAAARNAVWRVLEKARRCGRPFSGFVSEENKN